MYTDIHAHILSENYDDVNEILLNLNKNNIKRVVISGYNSKSNKEVLELVSKYDNVYGCIGLHPNYKHNKEDILFVKNNLNNPKIIATGEIGLDFYRDNDRKSQIDIFNEMLKISEENNKPIIVHSRDAHKEVYDMLKNYNLKGVIHSFTAGLKEANSYINLGYKLSVNGIITFKNSNLEDVIKEIDIKNILLETDSPYLTPHPYRKYKNEPKYISEVFDKLKEIYNLNDSDLSIILEENFKNTFDI